MTNVNKFQVTGKIKYCKGSILQPENSGLRFILSINNTLGKVDNNPLYSIFDKKWKRVKEDAKGWYANKTGAYKLGAINITAVQSDTWVIHMLCENNESKIDMDGLKECFKKVVDSAKYEKASIHVSNLLLNHIPEMNTFINDIVIPNGINVSIYDES